MHVLALLPKVPYLHSATLWTRIHPISVRWKPNCHYIICMWIITHHLSHWWQNRTQDHQLDQQTPLINPQIKYITGWGLLELISNNRMWGFPAAAKYRLSGVISSLLTCCFKTKDHSFKPKHILTFLLPILTNVWNQHSKVPTRKIQKYDSDFRVNISNKNAI